MAVLILLSVTARAWIITAYLIDKNSIEEGSPYIKIGSSQQFFIELLNTGRVMGILLHIVTCYLSKVLMGKMRD